MLNIKKERDNEDEEMVDCRFACPAGPAGGGNGVGHEWGKTVRMRNLRDKTLFDRIYYKAEDNLYINGKTGHIGWYQCRECGKITSNFSDFVAHSGGTATCTERAICEVCGASYGDYAHVFKDIEPKAPTCYEKGWKDGKTCINCGYTTCTYIDKRYHAMSISTTQAPTCTEKGWKESHCLYEDCDYVYRADIPALEHACVQTGMKAST